MVIACREHAEGFAASEVAVIDDSPVFDGIAGLTQRRDNVLLDKLRELQVLVSERAAGVVNGLSASDLRVVEAIEVNAQEHACPAGVCPVDAALEVVEHAVGREGIALGRQVARLQVGQGIVGAREGNAKAVGFEHGRSLQRNRERDCLLSDRTTVGGHAGGAIIDTTVTWVDEGVDTGMTRRCEGEGSCGGEGRRGRGDGEKVSAWCAGRHRGSIWCARGRGEARGQTEERNHPVDPPPGRRPSHCSAPFRDRRPTASTIALFGNLDVTALPRCTKE